MAIYEGQCVSCGTETDIFEFNNKCIVCTRLDRLEGAASPNVDPTPGPRLVDEYKPE